jgi:hypothetical protein
MQTHFRTKQVGITKAYRFTFGSSLVSVSARAMAIETEVLMVSLRPSRQMLE